MNVEELRTALREPPPVPLAVDLDQVLTRGRRRRTVRRAAVPVAVLATAAAVAVPVVLVENNGAGQVETAGPRTTAAAPGRTTAPQAPQPTVIRDAIPAAAYKQVIGTGEQVAGQERVFAFYPTEPDAQVQARFILGLAYRSPGGAARTVGGNNEIEGRDDAAGFHAVTTTWHGMVLPAGDWAVFGYYAGPATRITAVVDGRTVTARTARWPGYPRIVVFWLSPGTGSAKPSDNTAITNLRAYDAAGRPLPAGPHTEVGAG